MKKLLYILLLSAPTIFGQVTVTTITQQISGSGGLSLDANQNLYIADFGDFLSVVDPDGLPNDIQKLDAGFNLSTYSTGFVGASGNDFDSNGILYQSDIRDNKIYKIIDGVPVFVTSTGISAPVGLVFDSNDNFFVCNCGDNTIRKVTPSNISTLFTADTLFNCPNGITVDENDNLYVSNFNNGNIIKITPTGEATLLNTTPAGTTGGASNGHLDYHQPSGTLFIASHGSNKIYYLKLDNPWELNILAGSGVRGNTDGDATTASFSRPNGVAVTQTGDSIYINSAIPVTNFPNGPLNPQVIRLITGVSSVLLMEEDYNIQSLNVLTYPNPTKNEFVLEADLSKEYSNLIIKLYNISGKVLKEVPQINTNLQHLKIAIDLSGLAPGNYFYSVNYRGTQLFHGKVVKK